MISARNSNKICSYEIGKQKFQAETIVQKKSSTQ